MLYHNSLTKSFYIGQVDYIHLCIASHRTRYDITPGDPSSGQLLFLTATDEDRTTMEAEQQSLSSSLSKSSIQGTREEQGNNFVKQHLSDDYLENAENASKSQGSSIKDLGFIESSPGLPTKLFDSEKTNNLLYSSQSQTENQIKEQQLSMSSSLVSANDEVSSSLQSEHQGEEVQQQCKTFNCFYCNHAYPDDKERVKHIDAEHPSKMYYPTQEDFERRLL